MNTIARSLLPILAVAVLSSCTPKDGDIPTSALPVSYLSFNPPKGDPRTVRDMRKYGPGAILRNPAQTQYANSAEVIGEAKVTELSNTQNWTPVTMKRGSLEEKTLLNAAAQYTESQLLSAGLGVDSVKELKLSYEFGTTYDVQIPEQELLRQIVKNKDVILTDPQLPGMLRRGEAHIIQGVLVTDSLKVTVRDAANKKLDLSAKLTEEQKASLQRQRTSLNESELTFTEPRFAAYVTTSIDSLRQNKLVR